MKASGCGVEMRDIFDLLVEGETDAIVDIITGKQTTLRGLA
jgi:hypothetical protein